eukprot:2335919-Pyramimonas_sp.AAC.1
MNVPPRVLILLSPRIACACECAFCFWECSRHGPRAWPGRHGPDGRASVVMSWAAWVFVIIDATEPLGLML